MIKETTKVETTIVTTLDQCEIERLIKEWLDDRHGVKWNFHFDLDARGEVQVKATRKITNDE